MDLLTLKPMLGKKIVAEGLDWGDVVSAEGILTRINKESIVVDGHRLKNRGLEVRLADE